MSTSTHSISGITSTHAEQLATVLDGCAALNAEVPEVTLAINGATGRVDAKLVIATTDGDGLLNFSEVEVEL